MKIRGVEAIISPRRAHFVGDGFKVHNFIPSNPLLSMERMNPFLILDYNAKTYFPPSDTPRGVGVHPHKGFETVTIAYKGSVAHNDSTGAGGVIYPGDVQWMSAASGVLHKEFHEEHFSKQGGYFQMVQLWVNLSAANKKTEPKYQSITNEMLAKYQLEEDKGTIEVIAGAYKTAKGPTSTYSPVHLMNAKLNEGAKADFSFPANYNTALVIIEGEVKVNGKEVPTDYFVLLDNDGEEFVVEATTDALVLVMSGEPIDEPIVSHDPFVMNTEEEIVEAINDFNAGKFGKLA